MGLCTRCRYAKKMKGKIWNLEEIRRSAFEQTLYYVGYPNKELAADLNAIISSTGLKI